ncbi:hypothetical protein AA13755_0485 [Acetobacter peroxydans NBRC 13755]|nr:hypothetical protein AA13755_0485 [Acetobacter peroxydans NBRC 13755]
MQEGGCILGAAVLSGYGFAQSVYQFKVALMLPHSIRRALDKRDVNFAREMARYTGMIDKWQRVEALTRARDTETQDWRANPRIQSLQNGVFVSQVRPGDIDCGYTQGICAQQPVTQGRNLFLHDGHLQGVPSTCCQ